MNATQKIGIVSGIGPLAGAHVLESLLAYAAKHYQAVEDAEYPDTILVSHGIGGVGNTAELSDTFQQELIETYTTTVNAGATIVGIACNTAYLYLDKLPAHEGVTVINLIDVVAKKAALSDEKHLLISSRSSRDQGLHKTYLDKYGVSYDEVDERTQDVLDTIIEAIMAYKLKEAGQLMNTLLQNANAQGYKSVIVACTELPIAVRDSGFTGNLTTIDCNQLLAESLADTYYS